MCRKIIALAVTLLLLAACALPALANQFDPTRTGTISVTLTEKTEKRPIVGAELSLYYVATVGINMDGALNYIYTEEFAPADCPLDTPDLALLLDEYAAQKDLPATTLITDPAGTAVFQDLPLGMYLIRQTSAVSGYAPCTPFLVTLPGEHNGVFSYYVNATPKTEVAKLTSITIRKVWNTDGSVSAAEQVTVQLLRGDTVIETAVLNQENDWQVTYTDMPEGDNYSIKEVNVPKDFTASYKQSGYVFTVTNTHTLAYTGQLIWPIPVLAAMGMLFLLVGICLVQKKRGANE